MMVMAGNYHHLQPAPFTATHSNPGSRPRPTGQQSTHPHAGGGDRRSGDFKGPNGLLIPTISEAAHWPVAHPHARRPTSPASAPGAADLVITLPDQTNPTTGNSGRTGNNTLAKHS